MERCRFVKFLESKPLKILKNVKMQWIFMLSLVEQILTKYMSLVVNIFEKHPTYVTTKANLELLCDVETFLTLACIIPLLECVQKLNKFCQTQDVFTCDFETTTKVCKVDPYQMYYDLITQYSPKHFNILKNIVEHCNETLNISQVVNSNFLQEYATFQFFECTIMVQNRYSLFSIQFLRLISSMELKM